MRKPEAHESGKNRTFFVCCSHETGDVFYASISEAKSTTAQLSSSMRLNKGDKFVMMPVPKEWNGEAIPTERIVGHADSIEAQVNRIEGKGRYQVRLFTHQEHKMADHMRTGGAMDADTLTITTSQAGLVGTLVLKGGLSIESAARILSALNALHKQRRLVVIDLSQLSYFAKTGIGYFYSVLKEVMQKGMKIKLVIKPDSHIHEILRESKIGVEFELCANRDEAVAALLSSELE